MFHKQRDHNGFTIIELIIVLAVGGLILLFVILAIPTLQRNSVNNQRKEDVNAILQAVSSYGLNHSGNFPDAGSNFLQYTQLTYFDRSLVVYGSTGAPAIPGTGGIAVNPTTAGQSNVSESNNNIETIIVLNHRKCSGATPGSSTSNGAGYRDVVVLYAVETGSAGGAPKCIEL